MELKVEFAFDSSVITSEYDDEITNAAVFLLANPDVVAIVEGHTDWVGSDEYNQWLSQRRAVRVMEMIIDKHGVSSTQIRAIGYGESKPVADNETSEGRQLNRRVELLLDANNQGGAAANDE